LKRRQSTGEYLAFLSAKYEVDSDKLFCALLSAGENRKSSCDKLLIECRGKTKDKVIFLITENSNVVAQLHLSKEFLSKQGNPLRNLLNTKMIRRYLTKQTEKIRPRCIRDLRPGMRHVNLKAEVLEVSRPKHVVTKYGNPASLAKALIADKTGTIKLCLWNDQIDSVSAGDTVQIENARVSTFRGEKQLSLGKNGTLNSIEDLKVQLMPADEPTVRT